MVNPNDPLTFFLHRPQKPTIFINLGKIIDVIGINTIWKGPLTVPHYCGHLFIESLSRWSSTERNAGRKVILFGEPEVQIQGMRLTVESHMLLSV